MINILNYFKSAPKFTIWHSHPQQKSQVLITAGVDGDEYVGIKAAEFLINNYRGDMPITVIPTVNIAGNIAKTSCNPLDSKYPKHIYPGSKYGSSSSRLMNTISQIAYKNQVWIDLHGGSSEEHLLPFVWSGVSGVEDVDVVTTNILSYLSGRILCETSSTLPKIPYLAKHGTSYLLLESGEFGMVSKQAIDTHLTWVNQIIESMGKAAKKQFIPTYNSVKYEKYTGQDLKANNLLWYSPSTYVSGHYEDISR